MDNLLVVIALCQTHDSRDARSVRRERVDNAGRHVDVSIRVRTLFE